MSDLGLCSNKPCPPRTAGTMPEKSIDAISVDPDGILPELINSQFCALHNEHGTVFHCNIEAYNDAVGPLQGEVNMGPPNFHNARGVFPCITGINSSSYNRCLTTSKTWVYSVDQRM